MTPTSPFIGRMRARMNRAALWAGLFSLCLTALSFAKLYEDIIPLPLPVITLLTIIIAGSAAMGLVFLEERLGVWGEESRHIWTLAGWDPKKLDEKIGKIMKKLEIEDETV